MTGLLGVAGLISGVTSLAQTMGVFAKVNGHEPKNAPGKGLTLSVWLDQVRPAKSSGLDSSSAVVVLGARVQSPILAEPQDEVDPRIGEAVDALMAELSGHFTLFGRARAIDLLGMEGIRLEGQAGYIEHDRKHYRVFTLRVPMIVNNVWAQEP